MRNESMMFFDHRIDLASFISLHVKNALEDMGLDVDPVKQKEICISHSNSCAYVMFAVRGLSRNDLVSMVTSAIATCMSSLNPETDKDSLFKIGPSELSVS